jgi:hypothetical protein
MALSLVLAYSPADYATAIGQTISVQHVDPRGSSWYDARLHRIEISDQLQHPALMAGLIEHEVGNAEGDWRHGLADCEANEAHAYTKADLFARWFVNTFGWPYDLTPAQAAAWPPYVAEHPQAMAAAACKQAHL